MALTVLAATFGAGCGGDEDAARDTTTVIERTVTEAPPPEPETDTEAAAEPEDDAAERTEFTTAAGRICSRASGQSDRARGSLGLEPGETRFESLTQVVELTRRENRIRRESLRALRALDPPQSLAAAFQRFVGALERNLIVAEGLESSAAEGDVDRARELVRQLRVRGKRLQRLASEAQLGRCAS